MSRHKRWIVLTVAVLAVAFSIAIWRIWFPGNAFDPIAWQDEIQVKAGLRLGMADRLIARGTFQGKTRAEVVQLLGEPPPTDYFHNWDLVYWLGPERGFMSIDSEWLVFRFAADGRCSEYRIVRD